MSRMTSVCTALLAAFAVWAAAGCNNEESVLERVTPAESGVQPPDYPTNEPPDPTAVAPMPPMGQPSVANLQGGADMLTNVQVSALDAALAIIDSVSNQATGLRMQERTADLGPFIGSTIRQAGWMSRVVVNAPTNLLRSVASVYPRPQPVALDPGATQAFVVSSLERAHQLAAALSSRAAHFWEAMI